MGARTVLSLLLLLLAGCSRGPTPEMRAEGHYHAGVANLRDSRFEEAVLELRKSLELDPRSAATHHAIGEAWLGMMQGREAEEAFRGALGLEPDKFLSWLALGHALRMQGRSDEALGAYRKATELAPKDPQPLRYAGDVLADLGRVDEALAAYEAAARLGGSAGFESLARTAELLDRAGREGEAAGAYERSIAVAEEEAVRWSLRAREVEDKEPKLAAQARRARDALLVRVVQLRQKLGDVRVRAGDLAKARTAYEQMLAAAPQDAMGWQVLGSVAVALGDDTAALAAYEKARALAPESARVWEGLGRLHLAAGRAPEAHAAAKEALGRLDGDDPVLIRAVAELMVLVAEPSAGAELYRMLAKENEADPSLWLDFAKASLAAGRDAEARWACGRIAAMEPAEPPGSEWCGSFE